MDKRLISLLSGSNPDSFSYDPLLKAINYSELPDETGQPFEMALVHFATQDGSQKSITELPKAIVGAVYNPAVGAKYNQPLLLNSLREMATLILQTKNSATKLNQMGCVLAQIAPTSAFPATLSAVAGSLRAVTPAVVESVKVGGLFRYREYRGNDLATVPTDDCPADAGWVPSPVTA